MRTRTAFVGTYTEGESEGIYTCDVTVGDEPAVRKRAVTQVGDNPSFLALDPNQQSLYAVHEVETGAVTAFAIGEDDELTPLNRVEIGPADPCHCRVHPSGDFLFVAHYTGGAVSVLPIDEAGGVGMPTDVVYHEGSSVHPERQTAPHPHSIEPGPDGRYVYVPDLGADEVVRYEFDAADGTLHRAGATSATPGAGPRHLAFHLHEPFVFLLNELDSTMTTYARDPETGALDEIATESTLPPTYDGENLTADVHVHPSGRFVYGSNRGHHSIACFEIDRETGELARTGIHSSGGRWPRNFAIDPTGSLLVTLNMNTANVVAFEINDETGELTETGAELSLPSPVCMKLHGDSS
jgi:6-phosphogluconolactonase